MFTLRLLLNGREQHFFLSELKRYCPFIKTESLDGLDTYIPSNPRKLKALARGLRLFQSEGERHKPEEIDWKAVIFCTND